MFLYPINTNQGHAIYLKCEDQLNWLQLSELHGSINDLRCFAIMIHNPLV